MGIACGACSVQWGITSVDTGDNISTVAIHQYHGGYLQYCGGITAVHLGDSLSVGGDTFSTVEVVQYSRG